MPKKKGRFMSLNFKIESLDKLPEAVRSLYKQEGSAFVLDVDGAVDKASLDDITNQLNEAKANALGPEGKPYKDMFEGSQNALKAARAERDTFDAEIKAWKAQFETLDKGKAMAERLAELEKSGTKLTDVQNELLATKQKLRDAEGKLTVIDGEKAGLTEQLKTLAQWKADTEQKLDFSDAEAKIAEVVESIKEANQKALKRQLLDRYRAKELIRDAKGEIVSSDGQRLTDYAKDTMEAYGLIARSEPGYQHHANPSSQGNSKPTGVAALVAMMKPAQF